MLKLQTKDNFILPFCFLISKQIFLLMVSMQHQQFRSRTILLRAQIPRRAATSVQCRLPAVKANVAIRSSLNETSNINPLCSSTLTAGVTDSELLGKQAACA
jgi:hypothetical protein